MNCPDCRDRLQQWLDGRTRDAATGPGEPPALCPECAQWAAAARRLDRGLRLLAAPAPPLHLADRIVARAVAARRFRRYRVLFAAGIVAAAAVLAVVVWQGLYGAARPPASPPIVQAPGPDPVVPDAPPAQTTLRDSMAEAGSAVASLTTRTADETVEKTKILLPVVVDPSLTRLDLQPPLDPPTRSLREAGEGVSASLEPVADSARRAVGLFLRDLPPMDSMSKGGL